MSEQQKWPERGENDGRFYTWYDGRVYDSENHALVNGAYVPNVFERVAEKAMREMIVCCINDPRPEASCDGCGARYERTCPARKYLAEVIRDPKAWEVAE